MLKRYTYIICLLFLIGKVEAQNSFQEILDTDLKSVVDIMSKDYVFSGNVKVYKNNKNVGNTQNLLE